MQTCTYKITVTHLDKQEHILHTHTQRERNREREMEREKYIYRERSKVEAFSQCVREWYQKSPEGFLGIDQIPFPDF